MELERWDEHLFLPGPTPVPADVALAQALAMTDHRGPRFSALVRRTAGRLARLFDARGGVAVLPASGTGGLEAAIVNLFAPGERLLAVVAGAFGRRWADQAEALGLQVDRLEVAWGEAVDPERVVERLGAGGHRAVLLTQNETSTGVLQDVRAVAARVRAASTDALVLVDAVSGFPAVPLPMDAWGVDVVVAGSQKAFMLPPGLAFVAFGGRARLALEDDADGVRRRRFYFDLRPYLEGDLPYTPAVGLWYALDRALDRLEGEDETVRLARHRLVARIVREGAAALSLRPLAAEADASPTVTALVPPDGIDAKTLRARAAELGALFAGGQGPLAGRVLRVGHVGHVDPQQAIAAVASLEVALERAGGTPADGRGAAAAVATWARGMAALEATGVGDGTMRQAAREESRA